VRWYTDYGPPFAIGKAILCKQDGPIERLLVGCTLYHGDLLKGGLSGN